MSPIAPPAAMKYAGCVGEGDAVDGAAERERDGQREAGGEPRSDPARRAPGEGRADRVGGGEEGMAADRVSLAHHDARHEEETDAHAEVEPPGQRAVPSGSHREPERPEAGRTEISHATAGRRNSPAAPIAKITIHAKA